LIKSYNLGCKISTFGNIQALEAIHHYKLEDADKKTTLKCGIWTTIVQLWNVEYGEAGWAERMRSEGVG
jgi:hypothetical protein